MRIGLNLLNSSPAKYGDHDGFAISLVNALAEIDPDNQYFIFLDRETDSSIFQVGGNFTFIRCPVKAANPLSRLLWEQLILPSQARGYQLDLLHSPGSQAPLLLSMKSVVTVSDLSFPAGRGSFNGAVQSVQKWLGETSIRRASHVISASQYLRSEITQRMGISPEKVTVIFPALAVRQTGQPASWDELLLKHRINRPYVFVLSRPSPQENIPALVEAFLRANHQLEHAFQLLVGGQLPEGADAFQQIKQAAEESSDIRITGHLSSGEMTDLMAHATAYTLPSLGAGFSHSALAAMAAGVPILSSDRAALPEICADAALYVDPSTVSAISAGLVNILSNADLRSRLAASGFENLKRFSLEMAARQTLAVYQAFD